MASHGSCVITSVTNPASALDLPRVTAILAHPTLSTSKPLLVRAPGRVNLLGEHVDYSGYGVLPMAVTASVLIRIKEVPTPPNEAPTITVSNTDAKFETSVHPADPSADLDLSAFHWSYYFMCGYKGTFDAITSPPTAFSSLEIVVSGNIPSGAGLSSSSAFVVASTLATAGFYGEPMTRTDLAKAAIEGELYCGTLSGGMDQAASILSTPNAALYIQFVPSLTSVPVPLPPKVSFVVANCLKRKEKAVDAGMYYNLRVVECRLAALCIAKRRGWTLDQLKGVKALRDVAVVEGEVVRERMRELSEECRKESRVESMESIATLLECDATELVELYFADRVAQATTVFEQSKEFKIWDRARHVFEEALRVMEVADAPLEGEGFGAEMDKSHASCKDLFDCSCEELDALVAVCKEGGALGARLTGAGWGGCVVACVREGDVERFLKHVKTEYYGKGMGMEEEEAGRHVVVSEGGDGAGLLEVL